MDKLFILNNKVTVSNLCNEEMVELSQEVDKQVVAAQRKIYEDWKVENRNCLN